MYVSVFSVIQGQPGLPNLIVKGQTMRTSIRSHLLLGLLVAIVTFGSSEPASATEKVSYNYGSASYFQGDDLKGASILASGQAAKNIRLSFDYRYTDVDSGVSGLDLNSHGAFAGVGYMFRQVDWADFIVDVGGYFASAEAKFNGASAKAKDGGAFVSLRSRMLPANRFEVEPYVRYYHTLDGGGDSDGFDFGLEGRFYFSNSVAVQAIVEESDFYNETVFSLGIRFGQQRDKFNF